MSAPREIRTSSVHGSIGVLIALAVGLTFAFRSLLSFTGPIFWNATSFLDYVAVVSWSVALGMLALGAGIVDRPVARLKRRARTRGRSGLRRARRLSGQVAGVSDDQFS